MFSYFEYKKQLKRAKYVLTRCGRQGIKGSA